MTEHSEDARASRTSDAETVAGDETEGGGVGDRPITTVDRGSTLGRYVVLESIGRGAMGMVYAVFDPKLDRKVALKVLPPGSYGDEVGRARLLREAQALAQLSHPNVVAVHDVGVVDEQIFVAMEYLQGHDLAHWQAEARPWPQVVAAYVQAGRGLAAVHAAGLVHRDFKPANVFMGDDGRVRLLDFGLARADLDAAPDAQPPVAHSDASEDESTAASTLASRLTRRGKVVGTPAYMPPEQFMHGRVDARSDQFSYCVAFYEALFGRPPYAGKTTAARIGAMVAGRLQEPERGHGAPRWLRDALAKGLSAEAEQRFSSMDVLLDVLTADRGRARNRMVVGGLATVAVVAVGWGVWQQGQAGAPATPPACEDGSTGFAEAWGPAQRDAVQQSLASAPADHASTVADAAVRGLDDYAASWAAMARDACRATYVRGDQSEVMLDRRTACLARRRAEFSSFVGALAQSEAEPKAARQRLDGVVEAVAALSAVEPCGDLERLSAQVPPPSDPAVAREAEAIDTELSRLYGVFKAGRYRDVQTELADLSTRASATEHVATKASVAWLSGVVARALGELEQAEQHLSDAVWWGTASKADDVVANAATDLVTLMGYDRSDPDAGLRWADHARAAIERIGQPPGLRRELQSGLGNLHFGRRDFEAALAAYQRAFVLAKASPGAELAVGRARGHIGNALVQLGRHDEAITHYEAALASARESLGRGHPLVGQQLNNLGIVYERKQDYERATKSYEAALAHKRERLGPEHPSVGATLGNLANVAAAREDWEASYDYFSQALTIFARVLPVGHPHRASCLLGQIEASLQLGELGRADEDCDRLFENLAARPGDATRHRVSALWARARIAQARGDEPQLRRWRQQLREQLDSGRSMLDDALLTEVEAWLRGADAGVGATPSE